MKTRYLITYDICNEERLRRVFKTMKGAGEWLQYSVFQCDLSEREREELISDLSLLINNHEDQVLFINLGSCESRGAKTSIEALGRRYEKQERKATIL